MHEEGPTRVSRFCIKRISLRREMKQNEINFASFSSTQAKKQTHFFCFGHNKFFVLLRSETNKNTFFTSKDKKNIFWYLIILLPNRFFSIILLPIFFKQQIFVNFALNFSFRVKHHLALHFSFRFAYLLHFASSRSFHFRYLLFRLDVKQAKNPLFCCQSKQFSFWFILFRFGTK